MSANGGSMDLDSLTSAQWVAAVRKFSPEEYNQAWIRRVRNRCIVTESGCWEWQGFCHPKNTLLQALWDAGLRPNNGAGSGAEAKALRDHVKFAERMADGLLGQLGKPGDGQ